MRGGDKKSLTIFLKLTQPGSDLWGGLASAIPSKDFEQESVDRMSWEHALWPDVGVEKHSNYGPR